jgi:hypothetical protein
MNCFKNIIDRNNDYLFSPSSKINKKTNKIGYADNYNTNENKINRSNSFVKAYCSNLFYPPFCENIKQPIKTSNKKTIYNRLFEDGKIRIRNQKQRKIEQDKYLDELSKRISGEKKPLIMIELMNYLIIRKELKHLKKKEKK